MTSGPWGLCACRASVLLTPELILQPPLALLPAAGKVVQVHERSWGPAEGYPPVLFPRRQGLDSGPAVYQVCAGVSPPSPGPAKTQVRARERSSMAEPVRKSVLLVSDPDRLECMNFPHGVCKACLKTRLILPNVQVPRPPTPSWNVFHKLTWWAIR